MKVLVTQNQRGSPNGIAVHLYKAGKVYGPKTIPPMPPELAAVFVREGWGEAVPVVAKAMVGAPENKMLNGADENKAVDGDDAPADDGGDETGAGPDGAGEADADEPEAETEDAPEPEPQDPLAALA